MLHKAAHTCIARGNMFIGIMFFIILNSFILLMALSTRILKFATILVFLHS